jgi:hypothetical protein
MTRLTQVMTVVLGRRHRLFRVVEPRAAGDERGLPRASSARYQRRRTPRDLALAARLASPPLVAIVVPARNEALTIVDSVRALLALDYDAREVVVVNDGSTDDTLAILKEHFHLVGRAGCIRSAATDSRDPWRLSFG